MAVQRWNTAKIVRGWALTFCLLSAAIGLLGFVPVARTQERSVPMVDTSKANVPLDQIYFDTFGRGAVPLSQASEALILRLRDAIPPLTHPKYGSAKEGDWLTPDDLVIGYADGDEATAYPIKILNFHEIVNEEVDGRPILISYCPLCRSGIVYSRALEGKVLTFGNTSALYESDMVMYDHQTGSYWHQVGGVAIVGKLSGKRLTVLPSIMATWSEWRALHPDTRILSRKTGHPRSYMRDPFARYPAGLNKGRFAFPVSKKGRDKRLHPADEVLAIEVGGVRRAYPLAKLGDAIVRDRLGDTKLVVFSRKDGPAGAAYIPKADDRDLSFEFKKGRFIDKETGSIWNLAGRAVQGPLKGRTLRPVPSRFAFWFAIAATYPDIEVFEK
ncbi:MAG: DUF3179 domain-containing protein [Nitrospiria bacterium]